MSHLKITSILSIILIAFTSTSTWADETEEVHTYKVNVGDFRNLKVLDNVNVIYECNPDSAGYAVFSGRNEFADAFIFSNNDKGTLRVQVSTEDVNSPDLPVLHLYSNFLNKVENSSDFTVTVYSPAPCAEFSAYLIGNGKIIVEDLDCSQVNAKLNTGNGSIILSGKTVNAEYKMIGTGLIQADNLLADNVKCKILGTGTIGCYAGKSLKSKGIGSTKIYYAGDPADVKKSGGGDLIKIEKGKKEMTDTDAGENDL